MPSDGPAHSGGLNAGKSNASSPAAKSPIFHDWTHKPSKSSASSHVTSLHETLPSPSSTIVCSMQHSNLKRLANRWPTPLRNSFSSRSHSAADTPPRERRTRCKISANTRPKRSSLRPCHPSEARCASASLTAKRRPPHPPDEAAAATNVRIALANSAARLLASGCTSATLSAAARASLTAPASAPPGLPSPPSQAAASHCLFRSSAVKGPAPRKPCSASSSAARSSTGSASALSSDAQAPSDGVRAPDSLHPSNPPPSASAACKPSRGAADPLPASRSSPASPASNGCASGGSLGVFRRKRRSFDGGTAAWSASGNTGSERRARPSTEGSGASLGVFPVRRRRATLVSAASSGAASPTGSTSSPSAALHRWRSAKAYLTPAFFSHAAQSRSVSLSLKKPSPVNAGKHSFPTSRHFAQRAHCNQQSDSIAWEHACSQRRSPAACASSLVSASTRKSPPVLSKCA